MPRTILITGGSGFIGKNITESYLSGKYLFLSPTHRELDLTDETAVRDFFNKHEVDVVIHCAVKPGHRNVKDPANQLFNNTRMFFNIVRNAGRFRKMIFLSSGLVYDIRHYLPKMKEEYFDRHVPADESGFSKYICAKYIEKADNITELRIFGVFGRYEDYAIRFISNAICKTLFNLPITIKQNKNFDYIYIDDLMPVLEYFIENDRGFRQYNITPDHSIELYRLALKVKAISGKDLPVMIAAPDMGVEYSGSNERLRSQISDVYFRPIDEAIRELYNYYLAIKEGIDRNLLIYDK